MTVEKHSCVYMSVLKNGGLKNTCFGKTRVLGKLKSINVSKCMSEEMEERVKALEIRLRKLEDSVELRCSEDNETRVKVLEVRLRRLEDSVELRGSEDNKSRVELLEKRVKVFEVRLDSVEDDVELAVSQDELNEGDRKIELFEEKIKLLGEKVAVLYKHACEQRG